jgi:hypothetical protein
MDERDEDQSTGLSLSSSLLSTQNNSINSKLVSSMQLSAAGRRYGRKGTLQKSPIAPFSF